MKRRTWIQTAMLGGAGLLLKPAFAEFAGLRTITYNVLQCSGWPKSIAKERLGEFSAQLPQRYAMEFALYQPDIITFQEGPVESVVQEIAKLLKMKYVFFPSGKSWPGALMTRFDIVSSQNCPVASGERPEKLFTRHWGKAQLRDPKTQDDYIVHSAHLHPSSKEIRYEEVSAMLESMREEIASSKYMILQGDLNHEPDMPSHRRLLKAGLVDCYAKAGSGNGLSFKADTPYCRIDYVWANAALAGRLKSARALHEGAFRQHPKDPVSFALSDHVPMYAEFE